METDYKSHIKRTWTAVDAKGNSATCEQWIKIKFAKVGDVKAPHRTSMTWMDKDPSLECNQGGVCSPWGWAVLLDGPYAGNPSPDDYTDSLVR